MELKKFFSDTRKLFIASLLLHILLFLIFLLVGVGIDFSSAEYAEIGFISATQPGRPAVVTPPRQVEAQAPPDRQPAAAAQPPEPAQVMEKPKSPPVNLPKRRMLEDEEPQLVQREDGKYTPGREVSTIPAQQTDYDRRVSTPLPGSQNGGDRIASVPGATDYGGRDAGPVSDVGTPGTRGQPFTIEGDAANRNIMSKVIPKYPPGLQREAVIKIRFTVLPDGRVGAVIPMQKGDPTLDDITLKALKQWRFNPLPPDETQKNVQGVITFRYVLE
ncbi:TonB family protein [candidate division KSB1 bacterium]|nr:TonB family protein [candidate division KSB1 bacterium]